MSGTRELASLRAPEIGARLSADSILVQPIGAIEQHGPHLPFSTDLVIAQSVAAAAVEEVGARLDAWLLAPLAVSKSNEHAWSSGTFWLSATTLLSVLHDLGRCAAATPARRLVLRPGAQRVAEARDRVLGLGRRISGVVPIPGR